MTTLILLVQSLRLADGTIIKGAGTSFTAAEPYATDYINGGIARADIPVPAQMRTGPAEQPPTHENLHGPDQEKKADVSKPAAPRNKPRR